MHVEILVNYGNVGGMFLMDVQQLAVGSPNLSVISIVVCGCTVSIVLKTAFLLMKQ